jgi:hypothetical protein
MTEKPHKGRIEQWEEVEVGDYTIVIGLFVDHPEWMENSYGQTSYLVSRNYLTGEIETRNSRYTLGEPYDEERS